MPQISIPAEPVPFADAIRAFETRQQLTREQYDALDERSKARAFALGAEVHEKVTEVIMGSLLSAVKDGTPLDTWRRDVTGFVEAGGEEALPAARLDTIFRNAIGASFSAGRYAQMTSDGARQARPFWMYDAVGDDRTRPEHNALDGKVYASDDPFWSLWYPPNGHNCRCGVVSMTEKQARLRGVSTGMPTGLPAEGFRFNIGEATFGRRFVEEFKTKRKWQDTVGNDWKSQKLDTASKAGRRNPITGIERKKIDGPDGFMAELGLTKDRAERLIESGLKNVPGVVLDRDIVAKIAFKSGTEPQRAHFAPFIVPTLENPHEVWLRPLYDEETRTVSLRWHFVGYFQEGAGRAPKTMVVIAERQRGYLTAFNFIPIKQSTQADQRRRGVLIHAR